MADSGPPISLLSAALRCRCPRCGVGKLFDGLLHVAPRCANCGLDFAAEDAGDGPAFIVVFLLGAIVVGLALLVEALFSPPFWLHVVLWTPTIIGGSIALLRPLKALMIALQYRHRSLGGAP